MRLVNNSNYAGMIFVSKNKCAWSGHKKRKMQKRFHIQMKREESENNSYRFLKLDLNSQTKTE